MKSFTVFLFIFVLKIDKFSVAQNTTDAATIVESTLNTPALLINPTSISSQNVTDDHFETILKKSPYANDTTTLETSTAFQVITTATESNRNEQQNASAVAVANGEITINGDDYDESEMTKQLGFLAQRNPCECKGGVCGCCTGMFITALRQLGCLNITYHPEEFSFELKMIMNDNVLYKNRVTGRNPPPICVRMPRLGFIRLCASFYDLYFVGRNMHVCLEMGLFYRENEVFNRSFDCMRLGDKGVKIVKPEDGGGLFHKPGTDAEIDAGFDDIEEYDENAVVRRRRQPKN